MFERVWRGRSLPTFGTAVFAALLLTMTALSIISALVFRSLNEQRHQTADAAIREYASLGARLFGDRAFGVFEGSRLRILASVYGSRPRPGDPPPDFDRFVDVAAREMDLIGFAVDDANRGFFRVDVRTGAYRGAGGAAGEAMGVRIAEMIRMRPAPTERRLEPLVWLMADLPEPVSVGYTALRAHSGDDLAYYGFTYTRRIGWKQVGDAVMRDLPLLPGSFIDPGFRYGMDRSRTDSLIAIRLFDAQGAVLYESRPRFAGEIEGEFVFRTGPGGFSASATLHPTLVEDIRANLNASYRAALQFTYTREGSERRMAFPVDAMLPIVALLLAIVAGVGLWRERQLTRARRDFVASVSHELRTPLAQIRMFTETLQLKRERDEEERARWLSIVSREARRLGDLVENILLFSHIDADRARVEKERTDLGELIEEIVEGYVPVASQKGMRIIADAPSRIFSMVDPRAMRQIVVNLLDNALKYGPKGQVIAIELERIGQVARVVITDQGPGIPTQDRRRMWEPFVRLGNKGTTDGSGIGLAVVRDLVALHDATIAIDDAPGGGARFTLTFAISDSAEGLPLRATGEFRTRRSIP
ncbi:MAG: HAMP domain-containing histidine kinase [Cytophagaceae bacterium]|nr:HAMP domain-containing histidine kinase [Gemmatimonadaceae bacterium]